MKEVEFDLTIKTFVAPSCPDTTFMVILKHIPGHARFPFTYMGVADSFDQAFSDAIAKAAHFLTRPPRAYNRLSRR